MKKMNVMCSFCGIRNLIGRMNGILRCISLCVLLSIAASAGAWTATLNTSVSPSNTGSVTSDGTNKGNGTYTKSVGTTTSSTNFTISATPKDGYRFTGWSDGSEKQTDYEKKVSGKKVLGIFYSDNSASITANFAAVTVDGVSSTSVTLTPMALGTAYPTDEISFASTGGDALADFTISDPSNGWAFAEGYPKMSGSNVLVKFTYTADRNTYAKNDGTRTDKSFVTVTSKGDTSSKQTVNLSATFGMTITAPLSVTSLTITYPDTEVSGTVDFAVTGVDGASDVDVTIASPEGSAETWTASVTNFDEATGKVTVTYTCTAGASSMRGEKTATITLASKYTDAPATASCAVKAAIKTTIQDATSDFIQVEPAVTSADETATFTVAYASTPSDFDTPTITGETAGSTWTVGTPTSYSPGAFPQGTLNIPYTFTHSGAEGTYTATLTLTSKDGSTQKVTLTAIVEAPAGENEHVEVTVPGQAPVKKTWTDGLALANTADGSTIRLLQNLDLNVSGKAATQTVSKTMTIDLNGKTLSGTLTGVERLIYLNTAGKTLTIRDGRTGGKIIATGTDHAHRYTVRVNKGTVILESGTIEATSTYATTSDYMTAAVYVSATDAFFTMNGGTVLANHTAGRGAQGVYVVAGGTVTLNAGTIESTAKTYAYAVRGSRNATTPSTITLANTTLRATSTNAAYGIASSGNINVSGGTIESQTTTMTIGSNTVTGAGSAYGILVDVSSNKVAANGYYGVLNMTGGTIHATAATSTGCGICFNASEGTLADPQPAQDDSHTNKAAATGTVKNAIIYATTGTSYAYGVLIKGSYNSCTNASSTTVIENVTATVTAGTDRAYGIFADAEVYQSGATDYGNERAASADIRNCNITAQTTKNSYAYGVYVDAVQKTIVNTAKGWQGEQHAVAASAKITGGKYTAIAKEYYAYGVYSVTRVKTLKGNAEAYPTVEIDGGEFYGETLTYHTACGIQSGGNTTINGGTFTAKTKTTTSRGAYVLAGTFKAENATFSGTGTTTARGIEVTATVSDYTMQEYFGDVRLTNVTASAVAETGGSSRGLYLVGARRAQTQATYDALSADKKKTYPYNGEGNPNNIYVMGEKVVFPKATVQGGTYTARAKTTHAYGILTYNYDATNGDMVSATGKVSKGAELTVRDATIEAISDESTNVFGLRVNGPTVIDNCNITATATKNTTAYGVYIFDNKTKLTNSTITTSATTTAYGVYVYAAVSNTAGYAGWKFAGELESEKNKITVTTTTGATARGLYVGAAQATTTATPAWNLSNGQFACAASATSVNDTYTVRSETSDARAIYSSTRVITNGGKAEAYPQLVVSNPKVTVTSGTSSAYGIEAGGNTILDGGMFTVRAITTTAVGAKAPSGTFKATNTKFDVTAEGSTSAENASVYAYGIYGDAAVDAYYMNARYGTFELNNVTADVTTATGNIAYGVYMTGAQREQVQATYDALTEANKTKYPYYGEGDERNIYVMGAKAVFPKVTINGGTYTATAKYNTAVGIRMHDNPMISTYATATAGGELSVKNATISATTQTTTTAYGIHANGLTEIDNCKITATTKTTTARGVSVYANKTKITNSTITAEGTSTVYGVYLYAQVSNGKGYAGWKYVAELESENNTVTATANNGDAAYGLWLHGHATTTTAVPDAGDPAFPLGDYACAASATLTNDSYTALASGKTAYAVGIQAEQIKNTVSAAPTCTINGGKYWGEAPTTFADIHPNGLKGNVLIKDGYFLNNTNVDKYIENGKAVLTLPSTTTEYKEGYRYYLGNAAAPGIGVCKIGNTQYKTLEEALQVVTSGQTIIMLNSYTLPAGNYVLPTGASLLVPCNVSHTSLKKTNVTRKETYVKPSAYMTLTFAEGVNFTLQGNLEIGGEMNAQQGESKVGAVCGTYGHLYLENNARIDVESGAYVYAWGYVTGDGLINVKKGGTAYESFQIGDFKGGTNTTGMNNNRYDVFPVTHYFYQNIEAGIIYRAGAHAYGSSAVSLSIVGLQKIDNVMLVGVENETGMFLMNAAANGENVWVMKKYDPTTDRIHWTLNSDTELSSIKFTVQGVTFNSASYVLPIVGNMDITLNSGTLEVSKNVCLLPGVSLNIAKEAKLYIPSGQTLYVVDKKQWYNVYGSTVKDGVVTQQKYAWTPVYSPSWTNSTTSPRSALKTDNTNLPSAEIFVHGTIEVAGNLFTTAANTNGTDGGAWIHSTNEDAGKVFFASGWTAETTPSWYLYTPDNKYQEAKVTSAQLMNSNGSYTQTKGAAAGQSFNYINGEWVALTEGCLSTKTDSEGTHYYANPSDIVEVNGGNEDYTYSDVATDDRRFINTEGKTGDGSCAWWEVQQDANGWYASNETFANYGGYYAYDRGTSYWTPVTVDVIWTGDGMTSTSYPVHKGTSPVYLGASPTKNGYNWTGWRDGEGTFYDRNATLPIVMESTTYTAVFEENIKRYTVVFKDKNGGVLEAGLYDQGTIPTCNVEVPPILTEDKVYTFKGTWSPALAAVTKAADYTAQYTESIRMYPIHFLNADGTEIYVEDVAHGATPIYRGATPTRESNTAYSYEFNGEWQSSTGATGLAVVSGEEWYTAQFNAIEREYGDWLDVVDASASTLTLNMNGYFSPTAFGDWVISVGDNDYDKTHDAYKNGNRTIPVALPVGLKADDKVLIVAKGKNGVVESRRRYVIPHVYTGDATLDEMAADYSSVVFVQSGTLTVEKDVTLAAIYVAPGAALKINTGVTLAVDKLVLRTSATASASLTDGGRLLCKSVNYSRIVSDKSQAYPIALPFASDLSKVTMSNGKAAKVGTNFGLLYFDSQKRADGGFAESNWETVRIAEHPQMNAQQAYQLLSTSAYYSEYYFPVTYTPDAADATVAVGAYVGKEIEGHWGFNAVCSPYTGRYTAVAPSSPEKAVKISMLNTDNQTYTQAPATEIAPATMFFYQAEADGVLSFGSPFRFVETSATRSIVARRTPQSVSPAQTQWIQLEYGAADGHVDETNIYLHPDKFTDTYDLGYDLQKLSTSGGLPFIWTSAAYGDLAFAALPDSVATQGIALSMYAPAAGEMMLNVVDNAWMSRLNALYLMDKQADVQVDLLHNDYTWMAEAGTRTGRFYLYPILRKPDAGDVATDVPSQMETEAMVAYAIERHIVVEHVPIGGDLRCYDITGRLVTSCMAQSEQVVLNVPASGMYLIHADNGMCKVMVNE